MPLEILFEKFSSSEYPYFTCPCDHCGYLVFIGGIKGRLSVHDDHPYAKINTKSTSYQCLSCYNYWCSYMKFFGHKRKANSLCGMWRGIYKLCKSSCKALPAPVFVDIYNSSDDKEITVKKDKSLPVSKKRKVQVSASDSDDSSS